MEKPGGYIQREWSDEAMNALRRVPRPVLWAFSLSLAVNIVCFFYEIAQFPLGDHDVGYLGGVPLLSGGRAGRWFIPFLHVLSGHVQIPVWTQLLAFCAQISAGLGAVLLWRPHAGFLPLLAGGVLTSCMPNVTDFYYFHWMADAFPIAQLFMVLALHAAYRAPSGDGDLPVSRSRLIASVVLAVCGLATYQSCVMTWAVLFCGLCVMNVLRPMQGAFDTSAIRLRRLAAPLGAFLSACILYGFSLKLYPLVGLSLDLYQFRTISPGDLLTNIPAVITAAYTHLWLTQPFMGVWLKTTLLLVCLGGAAAMLRQAGPSPSRMLPALALLLLMPAAAKAQFFLSSEQAYYLFRFAAMGLNYMYLFFLLGLLCSSLVPARNAGFALCLILLPSMFINSLNAQVHLVHSNLHDFSTLNRVVARLEALPDYDPEKTYHLVQLGRTKPYIQTIYGSHYTSAGWSAFSNTVSQAWNPGFELRLLSSYLKLGTRLNEESVAHPDLMRKALRFVEGKVPFPAQGSVGIVDDTIVLFFDARAVEAARHGLEGR